MPTDPTCIFCKIIAGQIPSWKVYEDERVLAFLDVGPLSAGHTLIIPKGHYVTLDQMPAEDAAAIGAVLPRIGRAVQKVTGCAGWNLVQNNGRVAHQVVMHVHFHIIPRGLPVDGFDMKWDAGKLEAAEAKRLQAEIANGLTS